MSTRPRKIAIIAPPTPGHLNPLQVLAAELSGMGHQPVIVHTAEVVRYVTAPAVTFEPLRDGASRGLLDHYLATLAVATGPVGLTRMIASTADMTARLLDFAPDALRRIGADAIIADSAEPSGPIIAQHLGVPYVISVTGLPLLEEENVPPPFVGWRYRSDRLGRFRNRGGYRISHFFMRPIASTLHRRRLTWGIKDADQPLAYVAQCPRILDYDRQNLPPNFHYGSPWRNSPAPLIDPPNGDKPLIFCSLGSLQGARKKLFAIMAKACAEIGARAVIGHGGGLTPEEEASLPGNPLVRAFWPQETLLRLCSAAVLHGGFNTVLDALAAKVPIVAVPIAFEQPGTAARLAHFRVARVISPQRLSVATLVKALEEVVHDPTYRDMASRLSVAMEAGGGASGAAVIVDAALSKLP